MDDILGRGVRWEIRGILFLKVRKERCFCRGVRALVAPVAALSSQAWVCKATEHLVRCKTMPIHQKQHKYFFFNR